MIGSGNLGLVSLMEEKRRLTLEEIKDRHPRLIPALCAHPHVGWVLVRSSEHGAVASAQTASTTSREPWKETTRWRRSRRTRRST